jgi:hypothetical protein
VLSLARVYEQDKARPLQRSSHLSREPCGTWLQFAYEPEPSFRVALNALGGMEDSAAVAAMALLHLEADATPAAVRAAYRKTAAQWHPDKFATKPPEERAAAQRTFQKVRVDSTCSDEQHASVIVIYTSLKVTFVRLAHSARIPLFAVDDGLYRACYAGKGGVRNPAV